MQLEMGAILWLWCAVQAIGLMTAFLARTSEGSLQILFQRFFFVCLTAVGVGTVGAWAAGPCFCLVSGTTMAVMVLTAVWDFSREPSVTAY
jgi:hypothetical protein